MGRGGRSWTHLLIAGFQARVFISDIKSSEIGSKSGVVDLHPTNDFLKDEHETENSTLEDAYINAALILDGNATNCALEGHGFDGIALESIKTGAKRQPILNCNTKGLSKSYYISVGRREGEPYH